MLKLPQKYEICLTFGQTGTLVRASNVISSESKTSRVITRARSLEASALKYSLYEEFSEIILSFGCQPII